MVAPARTARRRAAGYMSARPLGRIPPFESPEWGRWTATQPVESGQPCGRRRIATAFRPLPHRRPVPLVVPLPMDRSVATRKYLSPSGERIRNGSRRPWVPHPLLPRLEPADGPRLPALPGELVWATTWHDEANRVTAPRIGLPALPVVTWPDTADEPVGGVHWKTAGLVRWASGRPFAWVDDEITDADRRRVADRHPRPLRCTGSTRAPAWWTPISQRWPAGWTAERSVRRRRCRRPGGVSPACGRPGVCESRATGYSKRVRISGVGRADRRRGVRMTGDRY
jgi:hypothetical protein